jgi:hypothetical protein
MNISQIAHQELAATPEAQEPLVELLATNKETVH